MGAFINAYYRFLRSLITVLMGLILVPVTLQIISRYTGIIPRYIWTEEIARFCFVWIVMIGAMIAVRDNAHFDVDLLPHAKTKRSQSIRNLIVHVAITVMALYFSYYGIQFAQFGFMQSSEMSGINMLSIYISFPLAGFTWLLFLFEKILEDLNGLKMKDEDPSL